MMNPSTIGDARISPTAHYTGFVWYRNGLSHPALVTPRGRRLWRLLRPANALLETLGRPSLDAMLLARHRAIDLLLERHIESGAVGQVLEVAAGFSPRGFQLMRRHPRLRYVEADLPAQADAKRRLLDDAGLRGARHDVVGLDALADGGPGSLDDVAARHLDAGVGTAIITEGLLNYFDGDSVGGMWRRFARCLGTFPRGVYLSDLNLAGDVERVLLARTFRVVLGVFARGTVHMHHQDPAAAEAALLAAGFASARVRAPAEIAGEPAGRTLVRVVEAFAQ